MWIDLQAAPVTGELYQAYGLSIRSVFEMPELPMAPGRKPDVEIGFGTIPSELPCIRARYGSWQAGDGAFLFRAPGIARFLVTDGNRIVIERHGGADDDSVRVVLMSTILAALLQQRGFFTLHASAVHTDAGSVLFAGRSGAGKSTLLAALARRGHGMVADDVVAIRGTCGEPPKVQPAYPTARLWSDSLSRMNDSHTVLRPVRRELEKFHVRIDNFHGDVLPIRAVFFLGVHNRPDPQIRTVAPAEGLKRLLHFAFRKRIADAQGRQEDDFRLASQIVATVPMHAVSRPVAPLDPESLPNSVLTTLNEAAPAGY